jgi:PKD repeat protein
MIRITTFLTVITLLVVILAGCTESPPNADFMASITYGNVPITIQFNDLSTGQASAWAWDFNNDQIVDSTDRNPQYTYTKAGTYTVILRVYGSGGDTIETKQDYIVLAPPMESINKVNPDSGYVGTTLDTIITGYSFDDASAVSFGDQITVNNFTVDSPNQITANISIDLNAHASLRDVTIITPSGTSRLSGGFEVTIPPPPAVTSVNPASGDQATTLDVAISGRNFTILTNIDFGDGITVNDYALDSSTQITAGISIDAAAEATTRNVVVGTPGGNSTLSSGFTVTVPPPPIVLGLNPGFASKGESIEVTITGTNFGGASEVVLRSGLGVSVNSFAVDSATQIRAIVSVSTGATLGSRDCSITTPGGMGSLTAGFEVVGINPSFGDRGESFNVVINGTDFNEVSAVSFGDGITVNNFTINSSTQITANISIHTNATPGPREILVTVSGVERHTGSFTIMSPTCEANFTATPRSGNGITKVQFTDTSTGDITTWEWDLNGDGVVDSEARNPSYTYRKNGKYTVTLTVSGTYCKDVLTRAKYIEISGCST